MVTKEESKEYSRGYQAGRRKIESELQEMSAKIAIIQNEQDRFWKDVYCASLNGFISNGGWGVKDETGKHRAYSLQECEELAKLAANRAVNKNFSRA